MWTVSTLYDQWYQERKLFASGSNAARHNTPGTLITKGFESSWCRQVGTSSRQILVAVQQAGAGHPCPSGTDGGMLASEYMLQATQELNLAASMQCMYRWRCNWELINCKTQGGTMVACTVREL